jgi:polyhydroxyalkanoate synthesis regulator protein
VQEMLTRYMEQSVGSLVRQQQAMRAEMAKVLEGPMAPIAEFARQNMEQWSKIQASMMSAFTPSKPPPTPDDEKSAQPDTKPDKNKK